MITKPKRLPKFKRPKEYVSAGRRQQRLDALLAKTQKVEVLEALIVAHETRTPKNPNPDIELIRDMKKRANEARSQLKVLSTVGPDEVEELNECW